MMRTKSGPSFAAMLAVLMIGIVVGISFIAQPIKFTAANVPPAQQVRSGSVTFHASHKDQLAVLLALAVAVVGRREHASWHLTDSDDRMLSAVRTAARPSTRLLRVYCPAVAHGGPDLHVVNAQYKLPKLAMAASVRTGCLSRDARENPREVAVVGEPR
jgi:hypothetical protein